MPQPLMLAERETRPGDGWAVASQQLDTSEGQVFGRGCTVHIQNKNMGQCLDQLVMPPETGQFLKKFKAKEKAWVAPTVWGL